MHADSGRQSMLRDSGQQARWYPARTRVRHEKKVAPLLQHARVEIFLPTSTELRRWSDRQQSVTLPLFSCYLFVRIAPASREWLTVLRAAGVNGIVGSHGGTPIPEQEIASVRTALKSEVPFRRCEMSQGERVRLRGGVLDGVVGTLVCCPSERRLVISIGEIMQSISVSVYGYEVEAA